MRKPTKPASTMANTRGRSTGSASINESTNNYPNRASTFPQVQVDVSHFTSSLVW